MVLFANNRVYQLLGAAGTYYGVRFGKTIPWVTEFPFWCHQRSSVRWQHYESSCMLLVGSFSIHSPLGLGYVFMMHVESKEDPSTRAKPLH